MKKKLEKKGFTLVELLAVIVVLAVIALITTPIILNVMDKAKKGALEDSAYGLIESANLYYAEGTLENNIAKTEFTFKDGVQTSENKLSYKGKIENGSVRLYSDGKSALCITEGKYSALKNINDKKVSVVKGRCSYNTETEEYETNGICQDLQDEIASLKQKHQEELEQQKKDYEEKLKNISLDYYTITASPTQDFISTYRFNLSGYQNYQNITLDDITIKSFRISEKNADTTAAYVEIASYDPTTGDLVINSGLFWCIASRHATVTIQLAILVK